MKRFRMAALGAVLVGASVLAALTAGIATHSASSATAGPCQLGNKDGVIKHVIYLQFDNTHYRRDNPNIASDLEQMPNLLNFLKGNGTLATNDHTILISHTAGGILSSLTGLYPDRNGMTVSNSYDYFQGNGVPRFTSSFKYWTNTVDGTNETLPNMVGDGGQTAPAPWLTYTHAGCNVGGVSAANIELENNSIAAGGDVATVYGPTSPEALEPAAQRMADFVGIAIHCARGNTLCDSPNAKPDPATTIPGSDDGYKALLGAKYVNPAITSGDPCVQATDGTPIKDPTGTFCGFPGFDGALAKNTLGEVAQMQEHGVPVTFAYISDAHDNHALARASGPGEADYRQQLSDYNDAFGAFFARLKQDGIDTSNTLFLVTVDEGDHFAGAQVSPDTNGVATYTHDTCPQASVSAVTPCAANQIGEVNAHLKALLPAGEPTFDYHFDDAPTVYVNGQPERTNPALRKLEQDVATATAPDPYKNAVLPIAQRLADTVEEQTLHMVSSDPKRTPSFTLFADPDFFFTEQSFPASCGSSVVCVNPGFAWNHGDIQDEIGNTWFGIVGPGVAQNGLDDKTWTDHVDLRPTINALLGLHDDYVDDGRVVTEVLDKKVVANELQAGNVSTQLGTAYKQINAPFGQFASDTLVASTAAVKTTDALKYDRIEAAIADLTTERDALAGDIRQALNEAAAGGQRLDENQAKTWVTQAQSLLDRAHALAVENPAS
ncbi:MAG: alkaline phosphatase family protein [Gaiellaceae bacterium]